MPRDKIQQKSKASITNKTFLFILFQDVLGYQNGCPVPGRAQRPGWTGLQVNTASDFTTRALSFQNAGFWPQFIYNAFQDRTVALVTGENSCKCSLAALLLNDGNQLS